MYNLEKIVERLERLEKVVFPKPLEPAKADPKSDGKPPPPADEDPKE